MSLPTGTVTFLFTDIEGSTKLWEQHPGAMSAAVARHDALLDQSIAANGGRVFKTVGDAFCAAFATAPQAISAALVAQQDLQREPWPEPISISVRMALHTGIADERDGDYFGPSLNRIARLLSTGHGAQILLSQATQELTRDTLPLGVVLQDLGAHSLRDLARSEQIHQLCHPDLLCEFPPLKSLNTLPNNLPLQLTSFVGRERELAQVKELLTKTRLLTLTGSGGCGKTRLTLQASADVLDTYPDGVWLVELAPVMNPDLVPHAVANVLSIKETSGKTYIQALTENLKSKRLLLVLDNCEHILAACVQLADALLHVCPQVKILASSREGLGIAGEQTYRVPSLALPDVRTTQTAESLSQFEAVRLFIDRAQFHKPEFKVTDQNVPALASVCHRLDGIPLAIELAAARIRSLSVEEINSRLDNRFRLLTGGSKTALPRQQTLRALIDWSYGLLTDSEKTLLCSLSVFLGGWTLSSAEAVCAGDEIEDWEVLDLITSLADKSLIIAAEANGATRYSYLETVRQYARDRLSEGDAGNLVRERHRDYFLDMAEDAKLHLEGPEQSRWLSMLETEHDNLRQAITFCLEDPDGAGKGLCLAGALQMFWQTRGHLNEGRERLAALLSRPELQARSASRAHALSNTANLAWMQADYGSARSLYQESLAIQQGLGNKRGSAHTLLGLGNVAIHQGDYTLARSLHQESLAIQQHLGDKKGIAGSINDLGNVAIHQGDYTLAQSLYEESLAIQKELGDKRGSAFSLNNLANVAIHQGDYTLARSLYEESLTLRRELGDRSGIAHSLVGLSNVASDQGDYAALRSFSEECLAIQQELGDKRGSTFSLNNLGRVAYEQDDYALARSLYEEGLAIQRELGDKWGISYSLLCLGNIAYHQGDCAAARSFSEECLTIQQELGDKGGLAMSFNNLGRVASYQGDYASAHPLFEQGLILRRELGDRRGIAASLNNVGYAAYHQGDYVLARSLCEESVTIQREVGDKLGLTYSLNSLGEIAIHQGDYTLARSLYVESLTLRRELGDKRGIASALKEFALLAAQEGNAESATRLFGASEALRESIRVPLSLRERGAYDQEVARVREALGEEAFQSAWAKGRAMPMDEAVSEALRE